MAKKDKPFRMLELYSGIGGMRYAVEYADILHEIVAAMDVNPVANSVYSFNFGKNNHYQRNIKSLSAKEIDKMKIDIITMSPPCQPFTRQKFIMPQLSKYEGKYHQPLYTISKNGLKKDVDDARTDSFLHVLKLLTELQHKPKYFLLENVKGFEDSFAHGALLEALEMSEYHFQEFLLSPAHFGIPNSRLRFYLIAKLKPCEFSFPLSKTILSELPSMHTCLKYVCHKCPQEDEEIKECKIKHFLEEDKSEEYFTAFLVPDKILSKYSKVLDIVYSNSSHSCCFTKAYGRYALGTGSVFSPANASEVENVFEKVGSLSDKSMELELLKQLKLRYFTPTEIANLMCFPQSFNFPSHVSDKQKYKTLGNSINVYVVSCLMQLLLETS